MRRNLMLHLVVKEDYVVASLTERYGEGRQARRRLLSTVRVPHTPDTMPGDVLRAVATQWETPVLQRWQPQP